MKYKLVETITIDDVHTWYKDCQTFTNNLYKLKTNKDIDTFVQYSKQLGANLDIFIFSEIFGSNKHDSFNYELYIEYNSELKKLFNDLKDTGWDLVMFFQSSIPLYFKDTNILYEGDIPVSIYIDNKEYSFNKGVQVLYKRADTLIKETFSILQDIMDKLENLVNFSIQEYIKVYNVNTLVVYPELINTGELKDAIKKLEYHLKTLDKDTQKYKLYNVLKNVSLVYDISNSGITNFSLRTPMKDAVSGYYDVDNDTIVLKENVSYSIIAHEFGHRYYYAILSENERTIWENFIGKNSILFYESELKEIAQKIYDSIYDTYVYIIKTEPDELYSVKEEQEMIYKQLQNNIDMFTDKERIIIDYIRPRDFYLFTQDIYNRFLNNNHVLFDILLSKMYSFVTPVSNGVYSIVNKSVFISNYGQKNPSEAYAETFTNLILGEYIPEIVLNQFLFLRRLG